jgi:hypothetical protein
MQHPMDVQEHVASASVAGNIRHGLTPVSGDKSNLHLSLTAIQRACNPWLFENANFF